MVSLRFFDPNRCCQGHEYCRPTLLRPHPAAPAPPGPEVDVLAIFPWSLRTSALQLSQPACPDPLALDVHLGLASGAQGLKIQRRRVKSRYLFLLTPSLPDRIWGPGAALHRSPRGLPVRPPSWMLSRSSLRLRAGPGGGNGPPLLPAPPLARNHPSSACLTLPAPL